MLYSSTRLILGVKTKSESPLRRMVRGSGFRKSMRILSSRRTKIWPLSVELSFTTAVYLMCSISAVRGRKVLAGLLSMGEKPPRGPSVDGSAAAGFVARRGQVYPHTCSTTKDIRFRHG